METPINVIAPENGIVEIRTGEALKLHHPVKINIAGDILTVVEFYSKRTVSEDPLQQIDESKAIVIVDAVKREIELQLDPSNVFGTTVKGTIELDPDFGKFNINNGALMTNEQVINIFKFAEYYFPEKEDYRNFINNFRNLKIKVSVELEKEKQTNGSSKSIDLRTITENNAPKEFILCMPIFKNQPKRTFRVEVWVHATDAKANFEFVSQELVTLIKDDADVLFAEQTKRLGKIAVIYK